MHYFARKRAGSRGTLRGFEYSIRIISLITFVIINSLIGRNYFDRLHGKNKIISGDVRGENHCCDRSISHWNSEIYFFIINRKYIAITIDIRVIDIYTS